MKIFLLVIFISLFTIQFSFSQNLELIGKEKAVKINGGININQIGYLSSDSLSSRDPYSLYLSGNVNVSLYGWNVPFTFTYSNQKTTYTQPFNQYSLHPYYKWIKLHIGYTSMSFSPYTLNGHLFLGAGVELTPQAPVTFSAMYGRLKKAIEYDSAMAAILPPEYERWGYGIKAGTHFDVTDMVNTNIAVTAFHAADKAGTLDYIPDSLGHPAENFVLSTNIDVSIAGHFTFSTELASSMITSNTKSALSDAGTNKWVRFMNTAYGANASTGQYSATKMNFGYNAEIYSLGIGYERIDPGYETFGAYYFNNDLENVTVNGSLNLLEKKVNLAANVGRQRDNLDDTKTSDMKRWVTALNASYNSGKKLNANISYSSFTSHMNIRSQFVDINQATPYDNLDTLNFTQISTSTSASIGYVLKNDEQSRQNLNMNFSHQKASDKQGGIDTTGASRFYMFNGSYSYSMVPSSFTTSLSFNTNINRAPGMETTTIGPSLAVNKLFFNKKFRNSLAVSFNQAYANGSKQVRVVSLRYNSSYTILKKHNLNLGLTFMNRKRQSTEQSSAINELIATLGYSFNF